MRDEEEEEEEEGQHRSVRYLSIPGSWEGWGDGGDNVERCLGTAANKLTELTCVLPVCTFKIKRLFYIVSAQDQCDFYLVI